MPQSLAVNPAPLPGPAVALCFPLRISLGVLTVRIRQWSARASEVRESSEQARIHFQRASVGHPQLRNVERPGLKIRFTFHTMLDVPRRGIPERPSNVLQH